MRADVSQLPMWLGAELKIIENVPVFLCDSCETQTFEPDVESAIRTLVATGFPDRLAVREVVVPVFDLHAFLSTKTTSEVAE
jgi:YgiT-type zinc finger domain-containing protein